MYSITSRYSFQRMNRCFSLKVNLFISILATLYSLKDPLVQKVKKKFLQTVTFQIPVMILGNKIDLSAEREVTLEEGERFAQERNILFRECSAKSGENIAETFHEMVQLMGFM